MFESMGVAGMSAIIAAVAASGIGGMYVAKAISGSKKKGSEVLPLFPDALLCDGPTVQHSLHPANIGKACRCGKSGGCGEGEVQQGGGSNPLDGSSWAGNVRQAVDSAALSRLLGIRVEVFMASGPNGKCYTSIHFDGRLSPSILLEDNRKPSPGEIFRAIEEFFGVV